MNDFYGKCLRRLRFAMNTNQGKYVMVAVAVMVPSIVVSVFVDIFVPFGAWWNLIRTVLLVPISLSVFAIWYMLSLRYAEEQQLSHGVEYQSLRDRFSPKWRLRIAAIVGAVFVVILYAADRSPVFTFISGFVLAAGLMLLEFVRKTRVERQREELGIPDARDIEYDVEIKNLQSARREKLEARKAERLMKQEEQAAKRDAAVSSVFGFGKKSRKNGGSE